MKGASDRVCVGVIAGARGVHGELRIRPFTERPEAVAAYGAVETETGERLNLQAVRRAGEMVLARAPEVEDREAALALKGTRLYVSRAALPETDEDEFYYADLIGLEVRNGTAEVLGTVIAVHNFGAGDLIEIRLVDTSETEFLPFTSDVVQGVDLENGIMSVEVPEGVDWAREEGREEGG